MIDQIDVEEAKARIDANLRKLSKGGDAAKALLWFSQYALTEESLGDAMRTDGRIVASATANADFAQRYVTAAMGQLTGKIMRHAIRLAQRDFDDAGMSS